MRNQEGTWAVTAYFEKHRKSIFYMILGVAFLMIYAYNLLTPYLSDDYSYMMEVREASSLWDLFKQQYMEYLVHNSRVVGQLSLRLSLAVSKQFFNVVNSGMFIALILLMYCCVCRKKKHDVFVLLGIITFLWRFTVSFGQTILWLCGACNYLWGSVFILGFVVFYRHFLTRVDDIRHPVLLAIGTACFGLLAGWCNENTSGGGLLLVLWFSFLFRQERKRKGQRWVYPFMISGMVGMLGGLLGMVLSPGVRIRTTKMEQSKYTGFVGFLSRIYKTTVTVRELFFILLVILIVVLVLLALQKRLKEWRDVYTNESVIFALVFLATSYVLAVIPTPMDRAFFGAGIFLMIACLQGIVDVNINDVVISGARYALISVLCLWLFFTYTENLVNLARIYREENERISLIQADYEVGSGMVVIPQFREQFRNPYSNAHDSDLTEDQGYWINLFYEVYYGVGNITAIPRDEWDELYGEQEE